jgi:membrane-bound ClpP family serine protease
MLVLGVIFMVIGFLLAVPALWTVGIVLAVIGAVLWVAEGTGAAWGRRWY